MSVANIKVDEILKLEDIIAEYEKDSEIEITDLAKEALAVPLLYNKYYRYYLIEKSILRKFETDMNQLRHEKWIFYLEGATKEQIDAGWKLPPRGKVLKVDVDGYLDSDTDIVKMTLKVGLQNDKVDYIKAILGALKDRHWQIRNAIEFLKFTHGA